ncbi:MAG: bifunctional 3,4-dihydroxy-2-butanone-4-phosphate synthase/GTP cyclohydrolase II, partial [Deltaproteobacteria bacterium]|nr:bifunctional 3,4-dihydroxy-2-butanone-4-phosphate synthase/GTP cyclohydrolase II [Deltaproteobacteria bacterium]
MHMCRPRSDGTHPLHVVPSLLKMSERSEHEPTVERYAESEMPTRFGPFRVVVYRERDGDKEHLAVVSGEVSGAEDLLTRVHSECLTGEALHSLRCDCRDQLDLALERIQTAGNGAI